MKLPRRNFLHLAASAVALPAVSRFAWAQSYPTRPVRLIVGFTPGGPTDIAARLIGQWLSERLGQPFVIENRPGAGSNIATEAVVNSPPDGYTLLMVSTSAAVGATFYRNLNFNLIRDIAPVAGIVRVPLVMVVNPSVPTQMGPEFIAYAKVNPGKINMASVGNGTTPHMAGELFKMMAGVDMLHVYSAPTSAPRAVGPRAIAQSRRPSRFCSNCSCRARSGCAIWSGSAWAGGRGGPDHWPYP
jgi:tripartite-type tricarboxylate transporter receptor subunit TctC